jgi:hypothetical protein
MAGILMSKDYSWITENASADLGQRDGKRERVLERERDRERERLLHLKRIRIKVRVHR